MSRTHTYVAISATLRGRRFIAATIYRNSTPKNATLFDISKISQILLTSDGCLFFQASKQESNADMADTNGIRSKMNSNGSVRIAADNTGCGANSHNRGAESSSSNICHHFTTAWDDTAVSMGLLSFLASIILIAANCPQRPPPSAGEVGWDMDGGRRRKQASSLSRAVSDIVVEKLLPRTCTLEYFWR